ncbi:hypothetical protein Tco_1246993, partial [Tanacetum coccineum]
LVSAGSTMILLVVILLADRLVSAGSTMILLVVILLADRLVSAGSTMILLVVILSVDRLFDIAGWLVSATSHLVSASSIQTYWCTNVSAECIVCAAHILILLLTGFKSGGRDGSSLGLSSIDDAMASLDMQIDDLFVGVFTNALWPYETVAETLYRNYFAFTRKLFSNMRLKWAGEEIPLTPPMLAIAAAGDAADEQNTAAHEVALEPVIFGPLPRPANYIAPEDIDNLNSMEDDTILGGFHEETHAGPDDAPTTTADAAGRAEDPALLTSLSAKIDRCMGRIDLLETELGTSKKNMVRSILTLVSRVKKLERTCLNI